MRFLIKELARLVFGLGGEHLSRHFTKAYMRAYKSIHILLLEKTGTI